ncbi:MAG: hypothetical protein QW655_01370 [Nitrososphaerota archaeon]|nr:hypothetical protein [Candidatus Geocrenenecus dongiae]
MLSEQDLARIKKEVDSLRNLDVVKYIFEEMPWMRPAIYTVERLSRILQEKNVVYAFTGEFSINLYGIPFYSTDLLFTVKDVDLEKLEEELKKVNYMKLADLTEGMLIRDLQLNTLLKISREPRPLTWDYEMVRRLRDTGINTKILSPEDYGVMLLGKKSVKDLELAVKIFYLWKEEIDIDYLKKRAEKEDLLQLVLNLLSKF